MANMCFVLRKDDEVVLTNAIYWQMFTFYEVFDEHGRISGGVVDDPTDVGAMGIDFPVALEAVNNYQVWDIDTHALLGAGPMIAPEEDEEPDTAPGPQER